MKRKGDEDKRTQRKLADYEILTKLGTGSFGVVYKIKDKADSSISVMKQINIAPMNKAQKEEALGEAKLLASLKSPYIVGYEESFIENEKLCIIMEYCENGDLGQLLKSRHGKLMEEDTVWKYFIEICLALHYLHNKKILHRDMKTMNVFLSKDFHVRLGDLGVAKVLSQNTNFAHTMVGTPYYLSPELCQEKPYNEKSDIWSLGCVLYELCALKHPFESRTQAALIMKIIQGRYDALAGSYSKELIEVVTKCLQKDYRKRPTIYDLLAMPSVQTKAKSLRIEVLSKEALMTKPQSIELPKKVIPSVVPASKAKKDVVKKPAPVVPDKAKVVAPKKDNEPPVPKPKKEVKKVEVKKVEAKKIEAKKSEAKKVEAKKAEKIAEEKLKPNDEDKPKSDKKPLNYNYKQPGGNLNNLEFHKLLQEKEKPIEDMEEVVIPLKKSPSCSKKPPLSGPSAFKLAKVSSDKAQVKDAFAKFPPSAAPAQSTLKQKKAKNDPPIGQVIFA